MTNQTIEQAVEELSKDWLFAGDEPKEDDFGIHKEFKDFLRHALTAEREAGAREYRQFILNVLNVLDGTDIADGECNTKAIRFAIASRIIKEHL